VHESLDFDEHTLCARISALDSCTYTRIHARSVDVRAAHAL